MAIALVGSAGAISTGTTTVTPAFGQSTTAGNLLAARVVWLGGGSPTTTASGWGAAGSLTGNVVVFYKRNSGASETAPTFTDASATFMAADLLEFSGVDTTAPFDLATYPSVAGSPASVQQSATDAGTSEVAIVVTLWQNSKSATATITDAWTPSGGVVVAAQGTGATKSTNFMWGSAYLLNGNGGSVADKDVVTFTPSTGVVTLTSVGIATFKPASTTVTPRRPVIAGQAVSRAANF